MLEIAGVFFTAAVALVSESCPRLSACRGAVIPRHLFDGAPGCAGVVTCTGLGASPSELAQLIAGALCKMRRPSPSASGVIDADQHLPAGMSGAVASPSTCSVSSRWGCEAPNSPASNSPAGWGNFSSLGSLLKLSARARDILAMKHFGEFAALNFPVVSQEVGGTNDRRNHRAFANDHRAFAENY